MFDYAALGLEGPAVAFFPPSAREEDESQWSQALTWHRETGSGSDTLQMGLGCTPATPSNTAYSIKTLVGDKSQKAWTHCYLDVVTKRPCDNVNCEKPLKPIKTSKRTLAINYSPEWNCSDICLTTASAASATVRLCQPSLP